MVPQPQIMSPESPGGSTNSFVSDESTFDISIGSTEEDDAGSYEMGDEFGFTARKKGKPRGSRAS